MNNKKWNLFPDGYLEKIEGEAAKILNEAHEAAVNPQSPDFIDGGTLDKVRRMALNILVDLDLMVKTSDFCNAYLLTEKGKSALSEWKRIQEKIRKGGTQRRLFPENGC